MRPSDNFRFSFGRDVRGHTFAGEKGSPHRRHDAMAEEMQSEFSLQNVECGRSKLDVWGGFGIPKGMILDNAIENISGTSISFPSLVTRRARRKS